MSRPSSDGFTSLAERLTDPTDRETYARLVSYVQSLPPGDEFRRLAELLGLVSLIGQRVPDALGDLLWELRTLTNSSSEYHARINECLTALPGEIADGVDIDAIAKNMGEAFRQEIAATGLREAAAFLRASSKELIALSGEISTSLKPITREYQIVSAAVSAELIRLTQASKELQNHNAHTRLALNQLVEREKSNGWFMHALMLVVLFVLGGLCGVIAEKRQTTDALVNIESQVERIQTPILPSAVAPRRVMGRKY